MPKAYDDPCGLHIGSTIWHFNRDKRRYDGGTTNLVTQRERWGPVEITGETSVSWLVGEHTKIPKNPSKRNVGGRKENDPRYYVDASHYGYGGSLFALSADAVEDDIWDTEQRRKIMRRVEFADVTTLRAIGALLGMSLEKSSPE